MILMSELLLSSGSVFSLACAFISQIKANVIFVLISHIMTRLVSFTLIHIHP